MDLLVLIFSDRDTQGNAAAVVGALIQASAYGVPQMLVGRICTGFAIGSISSSVPTYLTECGRDVHSRGPAVAINSMLLLGGVPLGYCKCTTERSLLADIVLTVSCRD